MIFEHIRLLNLNMTQFCDLIDVFEELFLNSPSIKSRTGFAVLLFCSPSPLEQLLFCAQEYFSFKLT